jgi:glycosyltransferase involved in cell wall biosynthesis
VAHWAVPCAWPIADVAHAPLEIVSHGGDVRLLLALPAKLRASVVRRIAARAAAWRFVSARLEGALEAGLGAHEASLVARIARVEACAIELPDVSLASQRLRAEEAREGRPLYVVVGRLVPSKRVDRAVEHVARGPRGSRLVVVGDGPERARLERLCAERGVHARFAGVLPRREALAWIGAADAVVHASRDEGLSTVVREAEALGVPVVTCG